MKKLSYEEVYKYIEKEGFLLLSPDYKNSITPLEIKCPKGHTYHTTLDNFKKKRKSFGCTQCKYEEKSKASIKKVSYNKVLNYVYSSGHILLTSKNDYKGVSKPIIVRCSNGHTYIDTFTNFKKRVNKCEKCYKDSKLKEIIERCEELDYKLNTNEFISTKHPLDITCSKGHQISPSYDSFILKNNKCRFCGYSRGEESVENVLRDIGVSFIRQYRFDGCRNIRPLPFDFFLPDFNAVIEYDGSHHYESVYHKSGIDSYERTIVNDKIKNDFCNTNNIEILRIPYFMSDKIDILIRDFIIKLKE